MTPTQEITTMAVLKKDRRAFSKMKQLKDTTSLYESDWELLHRFVEFFNHTKKEYLQGLLDAGIDVDKATQMTEEYIKQGVILKK